MTDFVVIDASGLIVNRVVLEPDSEWSPPDGQALHEDTESSWMIGGTVVDGVYTAPVMEAGSIYVPATISDRQFFQQLAVEGIITQAEALSAVKVGAVPAALQALIDQMPEEQRFGALMIISGGTVFERAHALTIQIGTAFGMSSQQIDAFFIAAGKL